MFAADPYAHSISYPYASSDPSNPFVPDNGAPGEGVPPSWPTPELAEQQGAFMPGSFFPLPEYGKLHPAAAAGVPPFHHLYEFQMPSHPGSQVNPAAGGTSTFFPGKGLQHENPASIHPHPTSQPQAVQPQASTQGNASVQSSGVQPPQSFADPAAIPSLYGPTSMPMLYPGLRVPAPAPMQYPMPMHPYLPYPPPFGRMAPGLFPYHPYPFGASPTPGSPMSTGSDPSCTASPSAMSQPTSAPYPHSAPPAAAGAPAEAAPHQPAVSADHGKSTLNVENIADQLVRIERRITCPTYCKRLHVTQFMAENLLPTEHDKDKQRIPLNYNYELVFKHKIWLIDDEMVSWPVEYEGVVCCAQRHYRLTSGWRNFVRAKNMKVGDSVIMERRGQNRHNIYVKVVRGPAIPPKARASRSKKARTEPEPEQEDEEDDGSQGHNDTEQAPDS